VLTIASIYYVTCVSCVVVLTRGLPSLRFDKTFPCVPLGFGCCSSSPGKKNYCFSVYAKIAEETEIRARRYLAGLHILSGIQAGVVTFPFLCVRRGNVWSGTTSKIRRVGLLTFVLFEVAR
jgi:hypothetical protein